MARAFLAAGNAGADEAQAACLHLRGSADGVGEMRVSAIDDDVARVEVGSYQLDEIIDTLVIWEQGRLLEEVTA